MTIAFSEALYDSIRTDLMLIEALKSLTIESRHLLDHCTGGVYGHGWNAPGQSYLTVFFVAAPETITLVFETTTLVSETTDHFSRNRSDF